MEGSRLDAEPSVISSLSVEGSALVIEPSSILAFSVEGSVLEHGTVRDMEH